MTPEDFDHYCSALPCSEKVIQWGGAHVWKVGGKVFAIGGWSAKEEMAFTFKCSPESFEMLCELEGIRPAPYMASRGLKWVQRTHDAELSDDDLSRYLTRSYEMAVASLTGKKRRELGL